MIVNFTRHAEGRMDEMGVSRQDVLDALREPEFDTIDPTPSARQDRQSERRRAHKGRICVCYAKRDEDLLFVITVIWNTRTEYVRPSAAGD